MTMYRFFCRLMIWLYQWEHDIGANTGMNQAYLSFLRRTISDYERDLRRMV